MYWKMKKIFWNEKTAKWKEMMIFPEESKDGRKKSIKDEDDKSRSKHHRSSSTSSTLDVRTAVIDISQSNKKVLEH